MNMLDRQSLLDLVDKKPSACVSIYIPTQKAGLNTQQNPIRLKNAVKSAEEKLIAGGYRATDAKAILQPALDLIPDSLFWSHQSDGLAMFLADNFSRIHNLPFSFEELVIVSDRFHLKPILPLLDNDGQYYILAISRKDVRLLLSSRFTVENINLDGIPKSMNEALQPDTEQQLQWHTKRAGSSGKTGPLRGHGAGPDDSKDDILRFLRMVDKGIKEKIGKGGQPLLLAGVEYLHPIYREANSYPNLMDKGLLGNPEGLSAQELQKQGWAAIKHYFEKNREDATARYLELVGTGKTSKNLEKVVEAAVNGRVEVLFVSVGVQRWGSYDTDSSSVTVHDKPLSGDEDLLDLAAVKTYLQGGAVYAVPAENVPDDRHLAAIFRY